MHDPAHQPGQACAIAVMAKAPLPGRVKTRLVPPLSPDQAGALARSFLRDTTENIRAAGEHAAIDAYAAYAPAGEAARFDGMLAEGTRCVLADGDPALAMPPGVQGFGRSLLHAARALFAQGYASVCLLNADSPTLPTRCLIRAARALAQPGARMVLGPAEDGGYYLIGLQAPHAALFADIAWSTDTVAAQTRARAAALPLEVVELDPWYDVDDHPSLRRLLAELSQPGAGFPAPATAACVRRLGLEMLPAMAAG